MGFDELQSQAESQAQDFIETIRQRIALEIVRARMDVYGMKKARDAVGSIIDNEFTQAGYRFQDSLGSAWTAGAGQSVPVQTDSMASEMLGAFGELAASMKKKITSSITRASLGEVSKEDLLDEIGKDAGEGMFKSFTARAVGIVSHELEMANSYAIQVAAEHEARALMLNRPSFSLTKSTNALGQRKFPRQLKVWVHSHKGLVPRPEHVALDKCAVFFDQKFRIDADDGTYYARFPHDPALPIGQTANCRCAAPPKIIYVTADEEKALRAHMAESGGSDKSVYAKYETF